MALPQRYEQQYTNSADKRIYFLGSGAVGTFVAHQLAGLPDPPPITLLLHWFPSFEKWREVGQQLKLTRHGMLEVRKNIDVEQMSSNRPGTKPADQIPKIRHLVVALKAHHTVSAVDRLKHRLDAESTLVFLQNGRGTVEEINETVFPDPKHRPRYILGTITHGLYRSSSFDVMVRGPGTITLSLQPNMSVEEWEQPLEEPNQGNENTISRWPQSSRYLLRTITRAPLLRAAGADPWDGLKISLTKLAQNAVVNPLTALFECRNGELQHTIPASRLMHMLLAEISLVYRSLPEATPIKFRGEYFSPHKLRSEVLELCQNTAENHSSMLQDIQAGRETEIDYINGWIVKRGEELGIKCVVNFTVQQMVKAKSIIHNKAVEGSLPIEIPPDKESLPE